MELFDKILFPIKVVVAWIMVGFHAFFSAIGLDPAGGTAWALSIVGLVVVIRIILIPLFVRQIRAQRGLQLISPELQAIQKKYKGKTDPASREAMSRETMELYRKHGTNPFSSCLPLLAQSPIFFALFRVLYNLPIVAAGNYPTSGAGGSIGPITPEVAAHATNATIFGAPISSTFMNPIGDPTATRIVTVVLIVLMSVTTFTTQRQLTQKNMPASALQGPMAQQQKMLLYLLPLIFAISGVNFPIGVLIYWTTTNLWSMGQQFYVIRRNPTPGSEAERQLKERQARTAAAKGIVLEDDRPAIEEKPRGQRQQPKRKDRAKGGQRPISAVDSDDESVDEFVDDVQDSSDDSGDAAPGSGRGKAGGAARGTGPKGQQPRAGAGGTGAKGSQGRAGAGGTGRPKTAGDGQAGSPRTTGKQGQRPQGGAGNAGQGKGQRPASGSQRAAQGDGPSTSGGPTGRGGAKRPPRPAGSSSTAAGSKGGQTPGANPRPESGGAPAADGEAGTSGSSARPPRGSRPRKPSDSSDTDQ